MSVLLRVCKVAGWLAAAGVCLAQSRPTAELTKSDPAAYLNRALDEMQAHALRRESVDWPHLRAEAFARAAQAKTTVDAYAAIRFALASLGDHHSSLHLTPELEKIEQGGGHAAAVEPPPASPFTGRYEPEGRVVKSGGKAFALVVVTKCFPENEAQFVQFESKLQGIVAELDRSHPAGWLVDLRGNVGGNMWPMLAGIGPLLGEGDDLGEFQTFEGRSVWRYRDGVAAEVENGKADAYPAVQGAPYKLAGTPKTAVLIDRGTGSSGEAIAIAFRGRANTRFFGEHTGGYSTVNETFALSDGASMWLTIGVDADRTGKQYLEGLGPDEQVLLGGKVLPDDKDPVIQAALRWLGADPQ